jgi:WD40 repeat protein
MCRQFAQCLLGPLFAASAWAGGGEAPARDRHGDPLPAGVVARLGTVRWRTTDAGHNAERGVFSPDGKRFIAWGGRTIEIFDTSTGQVLYRIGLAGGLPSSTKSVAVSPDGARLTAVSGVPGPTPFAYHVRSWDLSSGRELATGVGGIPFAHQCSVGFTHDGRSLVAYAPSTIERELQGAMLRKPIPLELFDGRSGKRLATFKGKDWLGEWAIFAPGGETIAVLTNTGVVRLFDGRSLRELRHFGAAGTPIYRLEYAGDGRTLATLDDQGRLRVWDVATGKQLAELTFASEQFAWSACFALAPGGTQVALAPFKDNSVRIHDLKTGREVKRFASPNSYISHMSYTADGQTLAANSGSAILVWDVATGRARHAERDAHFRGVGALAWSPDGRILATASGHHLHHALRLWDVRTGKESANWPVPEPSTVGIYRLGFSPDGTQLFSCEWDKTRLWDVANGKIMRMWPRATGFDPWAAFNADGKRIAVVEGQEIVLRETVSGKEVTRPAAPKRWGMIGGIAFAPDDRRLAVAGLWDGKSARLVVDAATAGKESAPLQDADGDYKHPFFSRSAPHLWAVSPRRGLAVWKLTTGQKHEVTLDIARNNWAGGFSPDGRLFALAGAGDNGENPTLSLIELAGGGRRWAMTLPMGMARQLAFSPDSRFLATTHPDSTVLIWDLALLPTPVPRDSAKRDLAKLWDDLALNDGEIAHRALQALRSRPVAALALCNARLHAVPKLAPDRIAQAIAELDNKTFAKRQQAEDLLARGEDAILDELMQALNAKPSLEAGRRLEKLAKRAADPMLTGERLRAVRAIELLEHIGTLEARALLTAVAGGAPGARRTEEARASVNRLAALGVGLPP